GIRVVKINGENATINDDSMRLAFNLIDFWFSAGAIAALFISTTDKGQRLGDILAQTAVIKNNPDQVYSIRDILNIKDRSKHEPTYLGVSKFTDEDMILIKNAITRVKKYPNEPHKQLVRDLAAKSAEELNLSEVPQKKLTFLKTLLQDYIVLTR
ncbi:MAG: RDD family protein, partial [Crocinitomicaceae bacterium]|nr:RDD family protein [Crocinitomicaceae bacterium]